MACGRLLQQRNGHYCTILRASGGEGESNSAFSSPASSASYYALSSSSQSGTLLSLSLGISLSLHCLTILHYLRYNNRFTIATVILWNAFFQVQRVLLSVLPLALGLLLFGVLVYGSNNDTSFGTIGQTFLTLFSIMNCDSIYDNFLSLTPSGRGRESSGGSGSWSGSLYLSLTFLLTNTLTLRLILAVIESLYFFLRLYTQSRKKRLLLRRRELAILMGVREREQDEKESEGERETEREGEKSKTGGILREHSSDQIQNSLLYIYSQSLVKQSNK